MTRAKRGTTSAPHPNSIAANLHKLTDEQRDRFDRNRTAQVEDAIAMEAWAKKTTGKGRWVDAGLSQDPLRNEGSATKKPTKGGRGES